VSYLLNTFASNAISLTSKSKSFIVIINQTFSLKQQPLWKEKKLIKMNLTPTNKVVEKWDLANTRLKIFKLAKNINTE